MRTNILAELGAMTSKELLAHIDTTALPRAAQVTPPGFKRPGRATTTAARAEGFAMGDAIAAIGSAAE